MAFSLNHFNNVSSGKADAPKLWSYQSSTDAIGTIDNSAYFDSVVGSLSLGDLIYIKDSTDAVSQRTVDSATGVTPVTTAAYDYAGTVGTSDIADGAVTSAKLAAAVAGSGLAGGGGSALSVNVDDSTIEINADTLRLKDLGTTAAKLAVGVPRTTTVAVSAAQFAGAYAAPFVLVAAPGANKLLIVHDAIFEYNFVAAQYANGGAIALQYDSTANGAGRLASATIAAATINGYAADSTVGVLGALQTGASTNTVNKGIYLSNLTGAFDTGDGTFNIHVTYSTVTTTV